MGAATKKTHKNKRRKISKPNNKISFDDELFKKGQAPKFLETNKGEIKVLKLSKDSEELKTTEIKKLKKKRKQDSDVHEKDEMLNVNENVNKKIRRQKSTKYTNLIAVSNDEKKDDSSNLQDTEHAESKRAQKRRKHAELLEKKKLQTEQTLQQNSLNYLSLWKYDKTRWKFKKLKQIWLQQNLYNSSKIPDEFWNTTIEYFGSSKGSIRDLILKEALKIIEKKVALPEENTEEVYTIKLQRARDIVQNL